MDEEDIKVEFEMFENDSLAETDDWKNVNNLQCRACLSINRQLYLLTNNTEHRELFLKICCNYEEVPLNVYLCWECVSVLRKLVLFKNKVQYAESLLRSQLCDETSVKSLTTLCISRVINTDALVPIDKDVDVIVEAKPSEEIAQVFVKDEVDSPPDPTINNGMQFDNYYDDVLDIEHKDNTETILKDIKKEEDKIEITLENHKAKPPEKLKKRYKFINVGLKRMVKEVSLTKEETSEWMQMERNSEIFKKLKRKCYLCLSRLDENVTLEMHLKKDHQKVKSRAEQCIVCQEYVSARNLITHMKSHVGLVCSECGYKCCTYYNMMRHIRIVHIKVQCLDCDVQCGSLKAYYRHHKAYHSIFKCNDCKFETVHKEVLIDHIARNFKMSSLKRRGCWKEENLKLAIEEVQNKKLSQRAAAEKYRIPRRTLRNHLKSGIKSKVIGKKTTLTNHQENELCKRIKRFAEIGLPLTPLFIRKQAFQFCTKYDIPNNFNHEKKMAGPDWLRFFLRRNPSISLRNPQIPKAVRSQKLHKPLVRDHFEAVRLLYEELDIFNHPERLYNMDEKVCSITVNNQNLAVTDSKRVDLISPEHERVDLIAPKHERVDVTAPEHAESATIAMCVNAAGNTIPPMIIFKGQHQYVSELTEKFPTGTIVRVTKKGSMTPDLFVEFIQHLGRHKAPNKCLLIFDGAKSHMSYEALEEAEKHDIVLYCLPSNSKNELQPLDKCVSKSFEHCWDEEVLRVLNNEPDLRLTKAAFNEILSNTWPKCMTHANIVDGFKATGLFPFNPEAIPEEAYALSSLAEIPFRSEEETENLPISSNQVSSDQNPTSLQPDKENDNFPISQNQLSSDQNPTSFPTTC